MPDVNLMLGDCRVRMAEIPDGSVEMILTDPPYGMDLSPQRKSGKFHGRKIANDATLDWTDAFFAESHRVTGKHAAAMFFCSHHGVAEFIVSARRAGFAIKNLLVWDKGQFGMGGNWRPCHELILLCAKGRFVTHSNNLRTILNFKKVHHSRAVHPTEKPVDLLEHLIAEPDYNPQVILDPFMGSGTTGLACVNTGRQFIGIEKDPDYFEIARRRIESAITPPEPAAERAFSLPFAEAAE